MAEEPPVTSPPPGEAPKASRPSYWPIAAAVVLVVCILALTFIISRLIDVGETAVSTPGKVATQIKESFRPKVTINTVISSMIDRLRNEPKLVVLTAQINVEVTKESEKNVLWGYVDMGTSRVKLRALGNKVQYYVPLEGLGAENFEYDDARRRLIVTVPAPVFDEDVVDVQSDPSRIEVETQVGWGRLDKYSGEFLRDQARRDLRPAVVREGKNELLRDKARSNAKTSLEELLAPLTGAMQENVEVEVRFK
ncbi:MAG: DUF4230 domain-containing protein [Verrucomicrobiota bacterium]